MQIEQRGNPDLAGALPAALTERFTALGWLGRREGRGLRVTPDYDECLEASLAGQPAARQ